MRAICVKIMIEIKTIVGRWMTLLKDSKKTKGKCEYFKNDKIRQVYSKISEIVCWKKQKVWREKKQENNWGARIAQI